MLPWDDGEADGGAAQVGGREVNGFYDETEDVEGDWAGSGDVDSTVGDVSNGSDSTGTGDDGDLL